MFCEECTKFKDCAKCVDCEFSNNPLESSPCIECLGYDSPCQKRIKEL